MRIYLTHHQVNVMNTLIQGGKVMTYPDASYLVAPDGTNDYTRRDTLVKLKRLGWIKEFKNVPVPNVSTWKITKEGEEIMKDRPEDKPTYVYPVLKCSECGKTINQ